MKKLLVLGAMTVSSFGQYSRGVNLAGAEFGENSIPGVVNTHYTYNSAPTFQYFAARSLGLMRIAFRWERLQPSLGGPLDSANLTALKRNIAWAKTHGSRVIIEPHNFARYKITEGGVLREYVIDNRYDGVIKVSRTDFADFWARLSSEFKSEPGIYAYDLVNEPHDMGFGDWKAISQAAVTAIRNNGDTKLIMVPGNNWSAAYTWPISNGATSWIADPANNFAYEAHQYFDSDNSGGYRLSYDEELRRNPNLATVGTARVGVFIEWCRNNNVRGYLGEYGVPNDDPRWLTVLDNFLNALDDAGMDGTYWAAGEWWNEYSLSVQPQSSFTVDRPQLAVLMRHLSPGAFTTVSAASASGMALAPDSLATGYGAGFDSATRLDLTDSSGVTIAASLIAVSPGQVNYVIPAGLALGRADATVTTGGKVIGKGVVWLEGVAPSLFLANSDGRGVAAGQILRVTADGTRTFEPLARFDPAQNQFVAASLAWGEPSDRLFLELYGTGFRNFSTMARVSLQIGSVSAPVSFAGRHHDLAGLDQLNAELPRSLVGVGEVPIVLIVEGKMANRVTIAFR